CLFADGAVERLREKYGDDIAFDVRIAPVKDGGPLGYSPEALRWYFDRSESMTGIATVAWIADERATTFFANAATLAAQQLGADVDVVRRAVQSAGLLEGCQVGNAEEVGAIAAAAGGVDRARVLEGLRGEAVRAILHANIADLRALGCDLRPTFVMENAIGDRMVLSGTYRFDVLDACIGSLLDDQRAYAAFSVTHPPPPGA
ncbi:MAG TPA: hypothetical protein VIK27_02795, partial [Candidatus Aquilonibacter sp.]